MNNKYDYRKPQPGTWLWYFRKVTIQMYWMEINKGIGWSVENGTFNVATFSFKLAGIINCDGKCTPLFFENLIR